MKEIKKIKVQRNGRKDKKVEEIGGGCILLKYGKRKR